MAKYNWIKFYPDDWNGDLALAACSYRAQGVYARLIAVLHRSEPYGYLLRNGSEPSPSEVSRATGIPPNTYRASLRELLDNGVLKRDEIGIYSARMVRDQQKREEASKVGKRGGNPALVNQGVNPMVKGGVNPRDKLDIRIRNREEDIDTERVNPLSPQLRFIQDIQKFTNRMPASPNRMATPDYKAALDEIGKLIEEHGYELVLSLAARLHEDEGMYSVFQFEYKLKELLKASDYVVVWDKDGKTVVDVWDAEDWRDGAKTTVKKGDKVCLKS